VPRTLYVRWGRTCGFAKARGLELPSLLVSDNRGNRLVSPSLAVAAETGMEASGPDHRRRGDLHFTEDATTGTDKYFVGFRRITHSSQRGRHVDLNGDDVEGDLPDQVVRLPVQRIVRCDPDPCLRQCRPESRRATTRTGNQCTSRPRRRNRPPGRASVPSGREEVNPVIIEFVRAESAL
jgi:hypothetical protein